VSSKRRREIIETGGLEVLKATIKYYLKDELMVAVCLQLFASLLVDSGVDVKLAMTVNLKSVLQKVVDHYHSAGDPYTISDAYHILKIVRQAECRVATEEIRYEKMKLSFLTSDNALRCVPSQTISVSLCK